MVLSFVVDWGVKHGVGYSGAIFLHLQIVLARRQVNGIYSKVLNQMGTFTPLHLRACAI